MNYYTTECSADHSISDISILAEIEMRPNHFKPKVSDSESVGYGEEAHTNVYTEQVRDNTGNINRVVAS